MKRVSILATALAIAIAAIAPLRAEEVGGISGFVFDRDSGARVADAALTIAPASGAPWTHLSSGTDGFFSDVALAPGRYFVYVNASSNHGAICTLVSVTPGETMRLRFEVAKGDGTDGSAAPPCRELTYSPLVDPNQTSDTFHM